MPIAVIFMIAVIALVLVGGVILGEQLMSGGNLTNTQQEIASIVSGVQGLYSTQVGFTGLDDSVVISAGIPPKNDVSGTSIVDPYGGAITLAPSTVVTNGFDLTVASLSNGPCTKLATTVDAYELQVNGNVVSSGGASVPVATAAADCNAGPSANSIIISDAQSGS